MENLTLETLPKAFSSLANDVSEIKRLLIEQTKSQQPVETDRWFSISELCEYIPDKPSKLTVYGWVHQNKIPHYKNGKRLRFLKSEIDNWLKQGRRKTVNEIAGEAGTYLNKIGGKNG